MEKVARRYQALLASNSENKSIEEGKTVAAMEALHNSERGPRLVFCVLSKLEGEADPRSCNGMPSMLVKQDLIEMFLCLFPSLGLIWT
jgi:hypothetical protein